MPILTRAATAALLAGLLAACATPAPPSRTASTDPVVLISLDGFHPDYLDPTRTPHLSRLARDGVRAAWMNPSYPTLTFPNHYTVVTGLLPDQLRGKDSLSRSRLSVSQVQNSINWLGNSTASQSTP